MQPSTSAVPPRAEPAAFNTKPVVTRRLHVRSELQAIRSFDITMAPRAERATSRWHHVPSELHPHAISEIVMAPCAERTAFNMQPLISRWHHVLSELPSTCSADTDDSTTCRARCIQYAAFDIMMAPRAERTAFNVQPSISRWHHVPSELHPYEICDIMMAPRAERTASNLQPLIS